MARSSNIPTASSNRSDNLPQTSDFFVVWEDGYFVTWSDETFVMYQIAGQAADGTWTSNLP